MRPARLWRPTRGRPVRRRSSTGSFGFVAGFPAFAWRAIRLQIDQHALNTGALQGFHGLAGQLGRQLHKRVVGPDRDVPEIAAVQTAFVGDGADDSAWTHLVPLTHRDAIRREALPRSARLLGSTVGA